MKLFTFFVLLVSGSVFAQIPNAGFENWTSGFPDDWFANNIPTLWTTITQSSAAHSGSSAVRGDVVNTTSGTISPYIHSGVTGLGFPFTSRPASIKGWYQFNSVQEDNFVVGVYLYRSDTLIAGGFFETVTNTSGYAQFGGDITYGFPGLPDNCIIQIFIGNSSTDPHVGSYFLVDDLEFSDQTVGVNDQNVINTFSLKQNYPNPFNPSTRIQYEIPSEEFVSLKIYDAIGNEILTLVNEKKSAGKYFADFNAPDLSSGIYFYKLTAGTLTEAKKMVFVK